MKPEKDWTDKEKKALIAAAEKGDAWAQCQLGAIYATGSFGEVDLFKSLDWYRRAAEQNFGEAQYNLGLIYIFGEAVAKDLNAGLAWLEKAAANNQSDAEELLGEIFERGAFGFPRDLGLAVKWYTAAVSHGNPKAKHCLGLLFLDGNGVPKDEAKGRQLIQEAAAGGYRYAEVPEKNSRP